ncbi:MAG: hypothetical protein AB7V27_17455 [Candidatus Binatia bacterium]
MSPTVTPTFQTIGPQISYMGVAQANGSVTQPVETLPDGTQVFARPVPYGFFLVIEAVRGASNRPPGQVTFNHDPGDPNVLPNLRIAVSRALGNGSAAVCDDGPEQPIGGVPAVDPPAMGGNQAVANAINDLGCRFNARVNADLACTRDNNGNFNFAKPQAGVVQFCPVVGIGSELSFPLGDTRVTAWVTDNIGQPGQPKSIIVRVLP